MEMRSGAICLIAINIGLSNQSPTPNPESLPKHLAILKSDTIIRIPTAIQPNTGTRTNNDNAPENPAISKNIHML